MLQAIAVDIAQLPGYSVVTTLEAGGESLSEAEVIPVQSAEDERAVFHRLLNEVDAVLVIAPETDGVLLERCRAVLDAGVESWNCSPSAIQLCGDKLLLAKHLISNGIPTIPTRLCDPDLTRPDDFEFPMVLKPRDGAGSFLTFRVSCPNEWELATQSFRKAGLADRCICQPYVAGKSLSVGVSIGIKGGHVYCLPVGEQTLSTDGRFSYLGGRIPADISPDATAAITNMVQSVCRSISGLKGYFGFDVILGEDHQPRLVEINPRLTTSYVGYRQIVDDIIPRLWLSDQVNSKVLTGKQSMVCFSSSGA